MSRTLRIGSTVTETRSGWFRPVVRWDHRTQTVHFPDRSVPYEDVLVRPAEVARVPAHILLTVLLGKKLLRRLLGSVVQVSTTTDSEWKQLYQGRDADRLLISLTDNGVPMEPSSQSIDRQLRRRNRKPEDFSTRRRHFGQ